MTNNGGMLDTYLIAQALGWEWNLGTILLIDGMCIAMFIVIAFLVMIFVAWVDSW